MAIHDDDVAAVKAATDLVALVTGYLPLRRVGRRWVGLCPFHGEKTPSFSVNGEQGLYYCFGCQRSGDAITFLQDVEQLDFAGAVEVLAGRAGVSLRYTERGEGETRRQRTRLVEALARAVDWYHQRLLEAPDAAGARRYLRSRGFDAERVRAFRLGWAPDAWDEAVRALELSRDVATRTGLGLVNRSGRLQDFFRGRVLFPIFDAQGDPVGFGGRLLPGRSGPKYLNPAGNAVYDKSRVLYGLNWAKTDAVTSGEVVVCEGYTDVIGLHVAGLPRAVAPCGTALTEDHVKLLTRFAKRVVLAFDADAAGQGAAERFSVWQERHGIDVAVAALAPGVDPGQLAQDDPDALRAAVAGALPFLAFRLERVFGRADLRTAEGRARAAEAAVGVIASHPNPLVRDQYLHDVASRCRLERDALEGLVARSGTRAGGGGGGKVVAIDGRAVRHGAAGGGTGITGGRVGARRVGGAGHPDNHERTALRLAVEAPGLVGEWFDPVLFGDGLYRRAATVLGREASLEAALQGDDDEVTELLRQVGAEQSDAEPEEVFLRLACEAADRELRMVKQVAGGSIEPALGAATAALGRWHSTLVDYDRPADERLQAGVDLLTWLLDHTEERG